MNKLLLYCTFMLIAACDHATEITAPVMREMDTSGARGAVMSAAEWYPKLPDGSPDYSAIAKIWEERVDPPSITWGSPPIVNLSSAFTYFGSAASAGIYIKGTKNGNQPIDTDGETREFGPAWTAKAVSFSIHHPIPGAVCKTTLIGAFADFRAWMANSQLRWGEAWKTLRYPSISAGPECVAPVVSLSPSGTITVQPYASQSFSAAGSQAGIGSIASYEWKLNDRVVGNAASWGQNWAPGSYNVSLKVTNTARLASSAVASVLVPYPEPPPPPPATGGDVKFFAVYGFYCYFISRDGGLTWVNTGICFLA